MRLTPGTVAFACHSKACAPPPAGTGGSRKAGSAKAGANLNAERDPEGHARSIARLAANKKINLDRRTQAAMASYEQEMISDYKAAQARGDIKAATKAAVEWAGVRADIANPGRTVPDIADLLHRTFMGPSNAKGRQPMITVPRAIADEWYKNNPPKPPDNRIVKTKYH